MGSIGTQSSRRADRPVARATRADGGAPDRNGATAQWSTPPCRYIADALGALRLDPPSDLAQIRAADLDLHLRWVGDACMHGVAEPTASGAMASLRRHIVDLVRQHVVAGWEVHTPDSGTMLDTMMRLEFAHRACEVAAEQKLTAELAGHGGINLMSEVAHDMRSPLTSIVFLSEVLLKGHSGPVTPLQRRQLGIVYSAALGLVNLASDLIEVNRSGRRRGHAPPSPFAVNGLLRGVHDLVQPLVEEKALALVIEPLEADRRMGYPVELSRVLLNLTTNALKYTAEGGVTLSARHVSGADLHVVRFSVSDTGPGIPDERAESLWQPLRHEPRRESGYTFSGTGLGLSICRRLVEWLGAELQVESSPAGTTFSFDLDLPPASSV
jgi:signal transduction histidine kinase